VQPGVAVLDSTSQLTASDDNRKIEDLAGEADPFTLILPLLLFDLNYRFDGERQLYLKTPLGGKGRGLSLGYEQALPRGRLEISATWQPLLEVWKNPYLTGESREPTDVFEGGLAFELSEIMGSGLLLRYGFDYTDVTNDEIGKQIDDLKRDGGTHQAAFGYAWTLGRGKAITTQLEYTKAVLDGQSNSYDGLGTRVSYRVVSRRYLFNAFASGYLNHYEKEHPLFSTTRDEVGVSLLAVLTWFAPFDWQQTFVSVGAGYSLNDADIDYFDSRTRITFLGFGYRF
jgi:hypothetical protein